MTPLERTALAVRLFDMNKAMRDLREHMEFAAQAAKQAGATDLAFATYFLSESIDVYTTRMNAFVTEHLSK